jgi:PAS domain S-box-containing protein
MDYKDKTNEELIFELNKLQFEHNTLKEDYNKCIAKHKSQEVIRPNEKEQIKVILDLIEFPIFIKDNDHKITLANSAFFDIFCMEEECVIGKTLVETVPQKESEHFLKVDRGVLETGISDQQEEELTVKGFSHTILTRKSRFLDNSGNRFLVGYIQDITNRKKAEKILQESFKEIADYKFALDESAIITITDENGIIKTVNDNFCKISQYTREELVGNTHRLINSKFHSKAFFKEMWDTIISGKVWRGLIKNVKKNGEYYWLDSTIVPFVGVNKSPYQYLAIRFDSTDYKNVIDNIARAKNLHSSLFDNSAIGLYQTTPKGEILSANNAIIKMLKFDSLEDLLQRDLKTGSYVNENKRIEFETIIQERGKITDFESEWYTKNGDIITILEEATATKNTKGEIVRYDGSLQDITFKKKIQNELIEAIKKVEESKKLLNETGKIGKVGGWEFNIDTLKQIWTEETYLIHEVDFDFDPNVENGINFYTSASKPIIDKAIKRAIEFGESFDLYLEIITAKNNLRNVHAIGKADIENRRIYGFFQDITLQEQVKKELIKAKEMAQENDKLKSAFLANMSHEIRTPMNGILGFSELLKNPKLSGEQHQNYIQIIEKSGKRMLNIINDIVDISKIEAGLMKMDIKESNINEQIEYIYTFFKPEVKAKGMQLFIKNTLPKKEASIKTDREKLFAILTNLVKNAIKYSNKGSIEFGYVKKGDCLEFFVKDTGIGISRDRQEAIFERFIQAEIEDEMARQGAGLGLSITKAYVEMLGGNIWVKSEEGIGSIFYFTLPYNVESSKRNNLKKIEEKGNTENQVKNLKILIAEDDEISEMLLSVNVSEFSNEIINVRTGTEAIEACNNNPDLDLILMDIQMPSLDGYEATRQIRKFNKDVIIIAQTAFGLTGDREKSLDVGCNDYITKPIKKDELDSLIKKYFNK